MKIEYGNTNCHLVPIQCMQGSAIHCSIIFFIQVIYQIGLYGEDTPKTIFHDSLYAPDAPQRTPEIFFKGLTLLGVLGILFALPRSCQTLPLNQFGPVKGNSEHLY